MWTRATINKCSEKTIYYFYKKKSDRKLRITGARKKKASMFQRGEMRINRYTKNSWVLVKLARVKIDQQRPEFAKNPLDGNGNTDQVMLDLLADHCKLNKQMYNIRLAEDTTWRFYQERNLLPYFTFCAATMVWKGQNFWYWASAANSYVKELLSKMISLIKNLKQEKKEKKKKFCQ